ncbi:DgyrCDS2317 [Dimorphilus gyrociliatus]|uniref:Uracil-DNA glycosylase n=1 Tax=Dimorphilus gyrociliatus TaxID=2664684 RepID=A0A7I8VBR0_9ANNE|nr:DgyrCDS2317 [Dimorphilus gyrociliatus]
MSQKKLSTFFKPVSQKRNLENDENCDMTCKTPKRTRIDSDEKSIETTDLKKTPISAQKLLNNLTPEQHEKMNANKLRAQMRKIEIETDGMVTNFGHSWFRALQNEFTKPYFQSLAKFVAEERKNKIVFPPKDQIFSFTNAIDISKVKVVILGQDPYHNPRQAHGLCFSVNPGVAPPPSLINMFQELESDIENFKRPGHGYLMGWAKQGVLLLNAVLTVRAHEANSHKDKGWEKFTDAIIAHISKHNSGVVFLLWGSYAQKKGSSINKKKHHILNASHPSPLSAYRGFFQCKHFSKCNQLLKKQGDKGIDWSYLPTSFEENQ